MAVDKSIKYEDQKLTKKQKKKIKPANQGGGPNYLGKQETVTVPKKWLSDPDHVVAELAYITPREQKILLDANIYGSLDGKPNKGPGGIMSLQGDLGGYSAPAGGKSGGSQGKGGAGSSSYKDTNYYKMMTGQKNIGQTTKTGPKTRKYAVPEYVQVKQPDGTYKNKYIGSGYKSYGQPSFLGNLFSRGASGYRGIKGMPAFFGKPGFETRGVPGQEGFGYYSDIENFGDTRDPVPLGIIGLLANLAEKFRKPKDMSEFNELGLLTDRVNPTFQNDLGNELMLSTQKTPERFLPNAGPKQVNIPTESYGLQNYNSANNEIPFEPYYNFNTYGTAEAAVPTDRLAPTPVENVIQDVYSGAKNIGAKGNSFLDSLYNADLINQLGYQAFQNYPSDSATGPLSDARHMAASNELSKSLTPFNNKVGEFIGDTLSYGAGLINEVPALFRGFNKENFDAIKEDLAANYAGTYGTPNTTTAQQIYDQVFNTNKFASTGFAEGGIASLSNRRG